LKNKQTLLNQEVSLKTTIVFVFAILSISLSSTVVAQDQETSQSEPPQILTSDLVRKQMIEAPTKVVSFVIVDSDNITEVTINGEKQNFEPDTIIEITKKFRFDPGKTLIQVIATDEAGNRREKSFLVGFGKREEIEFETAKKGKTAPKSFWRADINTDYEFDSNPTCDVSSPIDIAGLDLQGVVPDDDQDDTRTTIKALFSAVYGKLYGFVGASNSAYDRAENEILNSRALFTGIGYKHHYSQITKFVLNYNVVDVNIAEYDFSQNHAFSAGVEFNKNDSEGFYRHLIAIDTTLKSFADQEKDIGRQNQFKWAYNSLDAEKLDNFRFKFVAGSGDNGTKESENTYAGMDFDWTNQWEIGFKWDLGFGILSRNYVNEAAMTTEIPLGTTRVDAPFRFSNGFGWAFTRDWKIVYNYDYVFNISNRAPYVRTVHGLYFSGSF